MSGQTAVVRTAPPPGGDEPSLEALMSQYAGRVYRLALNITRNAADAEEVVQDVFFTVFRKSATFEGRSAFGTWLYRICINTALNRRRGKRAHVQTSLDELAQSHDDDSVRLARATLDRSQTPDQRLLRREARAVLNTAIDALPDHYRTVVTLRDVEELPSADVVEVLHESPPCVKTRLHRARLVLRERLASYFSDRLRSGGAARSAPRRQRKSPPD
jgi:RNA polymerase sigma-70 factor, ECF subfamily